MKRTFLLCLISSFLGAALAVMLISPPDPATRVIAQEPFRFPPGLQPGPTSIAPQASIPALPPLAPAASAPAPLALTVKQIVEKNVIARGGLTAWRAGLNGAFLIVPVSILFIIRHTRSEEEAGRRELLGGTVVGRLAPLTAALITVFGTNLLIARQRSDGSWKGDPFQTALVLRTLPAPSAALADTDKDSIPDPVEPILGTNPTVPDSRWLAHPGDGDLNLDGRINADDYFYIDQGFLQKPTPPKYHDGDFNFDGKINADDYFLIDQAFLNQQGQVLSAPKPALAATATATKKTASRASVFSQLKVKKHARRRAAH